MREDRAPRSEDRHRRVAEDENKEGGWLRKKKAGGGGDESVYGHSLCKPYLDSVAASTEKKSRSLTISRTLDLHACVYVHPRRQKREKGISFSLPVYLVQGTPLATM